MAVVTLHHELRFAYAGGWVAGGVFDVQLDLAPQQATLGVDLLGPELRTVAHLGADLAGRGGQRERHADLDRCLAARVAQHHGSGHGCETGADGGAAREIYHVGCPPWRRAAYFVSSTVLKSAGTMI